MDDRLRELRRRLDAGDWTAAGRYAAELDRVEGLGSFGRFLGAFQRATAGVDGTKTRSLRRLVMKQMRRTVENSRIFSRAWGSCWKKTRGDQKLVTACLADRELGFCAIAMRLMPLKSQVPMAWPAWKRSSREVPPPETVHAMNLWAFDERAADRAVFTIERAVSIVENFFTNSVT
jgi:hypothetical protein